MMKGNKLMLLLFTFIFIISSSAQENKMIAHFIDVGQGDATLVEFPCGAMLIDAGGQDAASEARLVNYLRSFFNRRTDLNNTLDLVIVTHAHKDHNLALDNVVDNFKVKRYIDNGMKIGSGRFNQTRLQNTAQSRGIIYSTYSFEDITEDGNNLGLTDTIIDPLNCSEVDLQTILLSGRFSCGSQGGNGDA